jgi:hypothetical protein
MAGNIHDHISKALKSKGKRTLEKNLHDESQPDQTMASDSALEERLTSIISPVEDEYENDIQTQIYWEQPPLSELNQNNLSEETVKQIYKRLYNKILEEHDFTKDDEALKEIHTLSTKAIISKIQSQADLSQFDTVKVKAICLKTRSQEMKNQIICRDIERLREKIFDFIFNVKTLPITNELSFLRENYNKRTDDPIYSEIHEKINEILTKGVFSLEDSFLIKVLRHIKKLIMLTPYDQAMLSSFILKNSSITSPFSESDIELLSHDIEEFITDCPTLQIEQESKFIRHALIYDIELIKMGNINEYFCRFDLSDVSNKSFSLLNNNPELISIIQSNISPDSIEDINRKLNDCQKLTQEYGYARIASSINKNDYDIISQIQHLHKNITEHSNLLNILLDLQTALETANKSTLSTQVEALDVILENLKFMNEHLSFLFTTLHSPGFDKPYNENIFLFRLGRGDFFKESDRFPLYLATFAIHKSFNPNNILDLFIDNFNDYSLAQKEICLEFVKNFIILDTSNSMIPIKYESNELIHKFELFCQFILANVNENAELEDKLNDISNLLINKIVEKGKSFSEYLNDITKNKIPSETLLRNINTINDDFKNNTISISLIEEYCIEINFIIESPFLLLANDEYTVPLENAISYFCSQLLNIPQFQNSAEDLNNKLAQRKNTPSPRQASQSSQEVPEVENDDICIVTHIVNEIAQGNVLMMDYEKHLTTLVDAIEQGFARRFLKIDICEMTETPWINDDLRIHNGLNPKSPNIRAYLQYYHCIAKFFTLAILCKIEKPGFLVFRESILETKRMYDFVEKMVLKAVEKGYIATANTLNSIFKLKDIKRLKMSNIDHKNLRIQFLEDPQMRLNTLKIMIQERDGLPLIQSIQNQLMMEYQQTHGSEFEKFVRIGQKLRFMEGKKASAKNKIYSQADIATQITTIIENGSLLSPRMLAEDIIINEETFAEKIEKASFNIKPTEFKEYSIHDIPSINDLKELLIYWHNRLEDFHFIEKQPEKFMFQHIERLIHDDENFTHFEDTLEIFDAIAMIDESKQRVYKNLEHDITNILSSYYKHVLKHLKSEQSQPAAELEVFFSIYNKHSRIKKSREANISSFNPFSSPKALKEIIEKIDRAQAKFNQMMNAYIQSRGQKTYTELLMKVLEGDNQEPIIHFGSPHHVVTGSSASLLPDSEFPVPQAEPEHPDYIGINRTMNFNPNTSQRSALEIFETKELQKDFQEAFPWSINRTTISQLEHARLNPSINLLATELLFNPPTQMAVMNYVLLALDCLGKISGFNGELAISNFANIKMISDTLQDVSDLLLISNPDDEYLNVKIDHMTYKLVVLNQDLIDMLQHPNPEYPVQNNINMNDFCHINEYLTHKLLGIPYQKSILSALNPESYILDAVTPAIKNEFLKVTSTTPVYQQLAEDNYTSENINEDD